MLLKRGVLGIKPIAASVCIVPAVPTSPLCELGPWQLFVSLFVRSQRLCTTWFQSQLLWGYFMQGITLGTVRLGGVGLL